MKTLKIYLFVLLTLFFSGCKPSVEDDATAFCKCYEQYNEYVRKNYKKGNAKQIASNASDLLKKCEEESGVSYTEIRKKYPKPKNKDDRPGSDYETFHELTLDCEHGWGDYSDPTVEDFHNELLNSGNKEIENTESDETESATDSEAETHANTGNKPSIKRSQSVYKDHSSGEILIFKDGDIYYKSNDNKSEVKLTKVDERGDTYIVTFPGDKKQYSITIPVNENGDITVHNPDESTQKFRKIKE